MNARSWLYGFIAAIALLGGGMYSTGAGSAPNVDRGEFARSLVAGNEDFLVFPAEPDEDAELLYYMPTSLKVARDDDGDPKIAVVALRDAVDEDPDGGAGAAEAYGYATIAVTLGPAMTAEVRSELERSLRETYPQHGHYRLLPADISPGSGRMEVSIGSIPPSEEHRIMYSSEKMPTAFGAEFAVYVPLTKQQAAAVVQLMAVEADNVSVPGLSIIYEAEVLFRLLSTTATVTAELDQAFSYVNSKLEERYGSEFSYEGLWVDGSAKADFMRTVDETSQEIRDRGFVKTKIVRGDVEVGEGDASWDFLSKWTEKMEKELSTAIAGIKLSQEVTPASLEDFSKRNAPPPEHRDDDDDWWDWWNLFGEAELSAYWSKGEATVETDRVVDFTREYTISLDGYERLPYHWSVETVEIPTTSVSIVDLSNAFYVREMATARFPDKAQVPMWGHSAGKIDSAMIEVLVSEEPKSVLKFHFDEGRQTDTARYWREAVEFERLENGLISADRPDLLVRGIITTGRGGEKIVVPPPPQEYVRVSRATDVTEVQEIRWSDLFGFVKVNGEFLFEYAPEGCRFRVIVEVTGLPGRSSPREYTLTSSDRVAFVPYERGRDLSLSARARAVGRVRTDYGYPLSGEGDIELVGGDLPEGWDVEVCR